MYKLYCRTYQFFTKIGNYFLGYRMPEYISGSGCIADLPAQVSAAGITRVFLVTGPNILKRGLADSLISGLKKEGIKLTVFADGQSNPTDINVEEAFRRFSDKGCEAIVAFGGGSPMDLAKAVAAKNAHPNKPVSKFKGLLKVHKKIVPFWAVPTTSGTGSETTVASIITLTKTNHKITILDPALIPKYAVLDPQLTAGLPPAVTANTGMDALVHAVESYTNSTYCTKLENDLALKAVKLIHDNLYEAYLDGSNIEARQNMQLASFYAGRSFTRGCVGYVHAIGHTFSGLYDAPHGLIMAIVLPHVMREYGAAVHAKLADLAEVCNIEGKDDAEKANNFIEWIEDMKEKMNIPAGYADVLDDDIPQIIEWAKKEANPLYPVPVVWNDDDFKRVLHTIKTAK